MSDQYETATPREQALCFIFLFVRARSQTVIVREASPSTVVFKVGFQPMVLLIAPVYLSAWSFAVESWWQRLLLARVNSVALLAPNLP